MALRSFVLPLLHFLLLCKCNSSLDAKYSFRFTNIKCESLDKSFVDFPVCRLTVPERNMIALNLFVKLYRLPVRNASLHLQLLKKASGYRPFLYNISVDFCQFMRNKRRNPFLDIFMNFLQHDSNINHTCPYNHDLIIRNMILRDEMFALLPLPSGEYFFHLLISAYNQLRADVKAYIRKD